MSSEEARKKLAANTNESVEDDEVEAHRMAAAGPMNTNEAAETDDARGRLAANTNENAEDDEVEAHGRGENTNETLEEDDDVEGHIYEDDSDDDDFDD